MKRAVRWTHSLALALVVLFVVEPASAHEMRPALLEIHPEGQSTRVQLGWDADRGDSTPRLVAPGACPTVSESYGHGVYTAHLGCDAAQLLAAGRLELTAVTPDAMVRVHEGDEVRTFVVSRHDSELAGPQAAGAESFVILGLDHILEGLDHLLFVLGLLFVLVPRSGGSVPLRRLALAITAFTVAHSITLALSVLDVVRLPPSGVEAAIAASLVLLGLESVHDRCTWTRRAPHGVAFSFGLLHGFGFAGALRDIGLPQDDIAGALFAFNIGVELGQLAFLSISVCVFVIARRVAPRVPWVVGGAYAVGSMGMVWLFERGFPIVKGISL